MTLDWIASLLCGLAALCMFTLHIISSPKRTPWMNLPEYVRIGLAVTGAMFMWRSVNFTSIAHEPLVLGHINAEGIMALVCFTYLIAAITFWVIRSVLPANVRFRSLWATSTMKDDPDLRPVMLTTEETVKVAQASGIRALKPNASIADLNEGT